MSEEIERLDIERRRLELDKLRAEIADASLAWWKRPGYLSGLAPILIAGIGVLSVWATGYFDAQRATLKLEIEGLKAQEASLQKSTADVQRRIDEAYISLKVASMDSRYAISHLQGLPSLSAADRRAVETVIKGATTEGARPLQLLLTKDELANEIVPITQKELERLTANLQAIPASKWAVELEPIIGPRPGLRAPDGRFYSPVDGKFYDDEQQLPERK